MITYFRSRMITRDMSAPWSRFSPAFSDDRRRSQTPRWRIALELTALVGTLAAPALACDLCAIYTSTEVQQGRTGPRIGVAEQFTYFGTTRDNGKVVKGANDEEMNSSITQILLGYNFTETLGAQLNVPIISRRFTRITEDGVEHDDETGFGDISLIAMFSPFRWVGADSVVRTTLLAGIKLPTGDTRRLREELAEIDPGTSVTDYPDIPGRGLPGFPGTGSSQTTTVVSNHTTGEHGASALHGHDLALGSGSVDGVFGARLFGTWKRLFAVGTVQYLVRSEGRFDYHYADELLWRVGPGVFLALDDVALERGYTLNVSAIFSGATKGKDHISSIELDDTGFTGLYLGPSATFTWGESLQANLGADFPVRQNNTDVQLVPDYRIRAAMTWRF